MEVDQVAVIAFKVCLALLLCLVSLSKKIRLHECLVWCLIACC